MANAKMNSYLSDKLKVMSFLCIVLVVWIHTYYTEGEGYISSVLLMNIWGCGVCMLAVPMFYIMSGYLFFLKADRMGVIFIKQKKRVRTLLIPYLLSNVISIGFYWLLGMTADYIPVLQAIINNNLLDKASGQGALHWLYYCFWEGPIAFQLWFVRDLMVFVLFTPILYLILKFFSFRKWLTCGGIILFAGIAFYHYNSFTWALGWFMLGSLLSMSNHVGIIQTDSIRLCAFVGSFITLGFILVDALYAAGLTGYFARQDFITLLGVPSAWVLYDCIIKKRIICGKSIVATVCSCSFFIYLVHEPFLNIFKKIPLLCGRNVWMVNLGYLICPVVFIIGCIILAVILKRYVPKAYGVFTGGR